MRRSISTNLTIKIENMSKKFENQQVLDHVNLYCESGSITGIMGRNGTGKSVLFKCICDFIKPDEGTILINGQQNSDYIRKECKIGATIEEPAFLKQYSGIKNLELLYVTRNKADKNKLIRIMQLVGLDPDLKKNVGKYSMGMKQRLAIAQAIMEEQKILLFDEPMNGLDSDGIEQIKELFYDLKEQGCVILIASHNRDDLEEICDSIYEIKKGRLHLIYPN